MASTQHLQSLQALGTIGMPEYTERKQRLVDELTGTTMRKDPAKPVAPPADQSVRNKPEKRQAKKDPVFVQEGFLKGRDVTLLTI